MTDTEMLTRYDPAETLRSAEAVIHFIADAIDGGDKDYLTHAMSIAARAEGMFEITRVTGLGSDAVLKSFLECGTPSVESFYARLGSLRLNPEPDVSTA